MLDGLFLFSLLSISSRRMWVTLGLHNRTAPGSAITKKVKVIIEHPDYDRIDISSDIAMLKVDLTEDEATAAGAKPVCLPTTQVVSENHALVSGWGTTSSGMWKLRGPDNQFVKIILFIV